MQGQRRYNIDVELTPGLLWLLLFLLGCFEFILTNLFDFTIGGNFSPATSVGSFLKADQASSRFGKAPMKGLKRNTSTPATPSHSTRAQTPRTHCVGMYIVSVVEFRAKDKTIGLAALDMKSPTIHLYQFGDNQVYSNMLMLLNQVRNVLLLSPFRLVSFLMYVSYGFVLYLVFCWDSTNPRRSSFVTQPRKPPCTISWEVGHFVLWWAFVIVIDAQL